ncbi:MAG: putative endopeptidase [Parcubacteria bacterium C7867-001]|nr:MAG: putative endopeptidase [Parcubacteria bacterium C7867-001]
MQKTVSLPISVRDMDIRVRPQDDFYRYANGGWLARTKIPKTEPRWGSFVMLRYDTEKKLKMILADLLSLKRAAHGSPEQMIRDFYRSGMDLKTRTKLGAKPLAPWRERIEKLETLTELQDLVADLHRIGVGPLFNAGIDQDAKNTTKYILHVFQDGLGMPDRDYYLKDDAESKRVRNAYVPHVAAMLALLGYKPAEAKRRSAVVMQIETALAKKQMNKVDRREVEKTYNKRSLAALQKSSPAIDWKRYFARIGAGTANNFIVMQPDYLAALSKLLMSTPLADWKIYLEWCVLDDFAGVLSPNVAKQNFAFYGTVLTGTKHMKPLWRRTLAVVNGNLGELIGQIYVKKYFTAHAKKCMNELVDDLFFAYRERIKELPWMSPSTKKKALQKLAAMNKKIGYPDKWKSYRGLEIRADDFVGNAVRTAEYEHKRQMKKLHGPIDRDEWFMYPQTVNAYNAPNMNEIAFPAAILQPPFFDPDGDDAFNYGSMGAVIAHEISHGFDDEGAKYDKNGNLNNWWTALDKKRFEAKGKALVRQFNEYVVADGVKVNGKLTLGENIADSVGLLMGYEALQHALKRTGRRTIKGFTPEQRFFLGFAQFERENIRPEYEKTITLTDPHSPGQFRINGPVSNFGPFYEAYGVKKGDKLWREPKDRETVW